MKTIIGIDIGKYYLDIAINDKIIRVKNLEPEIQEFLDKIKSQDACDNILVVCEATGGYERTLVSILNKNQIGIHLAHPNKIRAFAKSRGLLAKTDKIDALLISDYAKTMGVDADIVYFSETSQKIAQALKRRQQLIDDKLREQARADKEIYPAIKNSIETHIKWLDKEIETINKLLDEYTVFNRDSGKFRGKRFIQGGRAIMRKALYMSAVASLRWNNDMKVFYTRLVKIGKPIKVALVAVMRKIIILANSIIKRQSPWQKALSNRCSTFSTLLYTSLVLLHCSV